MTEPFLFRFTPSLMEREALEAIFVQREAMVQRILDLTRDSVLTPAKHHTLLIGPRGIGKTHLVSLIYHRVNAMEDLRDKLLIAWMREEEWGITSLLDLLLRIFRALATEYKDKTLNKRVAALYSLPPNQAETAAGKLLKEYVGDRTLLVLIENLDDIFQGLADKGQKRLRAYIQENPFFTIVATAQSLFNGVIRHTSPFYGFFRIQHLEGLSIEESTQLLLNIARYKGEQDLAAFIQTPMGRARIRAVNHLAGGNHRVYIIFSQFLTRESLDQLVEPFMQMLDDLTPYYQDRMRWLSQQQRKIVEFLLNHRSPATVKEIARRCFMTHQTASSQLKSLREMEYVQSESQGRESYYELREPLMRLCVEVKKSRGEPISLFVDFLRLWYSKDELQQRLEFLQPEAALEREYVIHALKAIEEESQDPRIAACLKDLKTYATAEDISHALQVTEELLAINKREVSIWRFQFFLLYKLGRYDEALTSAETVLGIQPDETYPVYFKAITLLALNRVEEALELSDKLINLEPSDYSSWHLRLIILNRLERWDEMLAACNEAIRLEMNHPEIWMYRGKVLKNLECLDEAFESYQKAIDLNPGDIKAYFEQGVILARLGQWERALSIFGQALELDQSNSLVWGYQGVVLASLGRMEEAQAAINKATALAPNEGSTWMGQGVLLTRLGRGEEAIGSFNKALELSLQDVPVLAVRAVALFALGRWNEGFAALEDLFPRITTDSNLIRVGIKAVISLIFNSTRDVAVWKTRIASLLKLFDNHLAVPTLGIGLVEAISTLESEMVSDAAARAWRDVWQELAGDREEFQLPLRLLDVAVRYREKKDPRILLELPLEERKLLNQVLKVQEQTAE